MSKGLFVTGTGTDVGKTFVTALIIKKLRQAGINAGYYKAALSGAYERNGELVPGDAEYVCKTADIEKNPRECVSYIYKNAYSPHLAAILEGNHLETDVIINDFNKSINEYEYLTVEGCGGIICPIRYDKNFMLEDIIKLFSLSTIIIADAGLGTINSVVLTVEYMKSHNIKINGIIFNNYHYGSILEENNIKMVEEMTGIKVIAKVNCDADDIDIDIDLLKSLYEDVKEVSDDTAI